MKRWRADPTEENFWGVVLAYAGVKFKTYTGLPFLTKLKKGRNGQIHKGTLDRPPGKQQKSGVELGAAGTEEY